MQSLPKSTVLSKVLVLATVVAFTLYAVGGLVSQWLKAKFTFPAVPLAGIPFPIEVDAHFGLTESCSERKVMGTVISDKCSQKGARDFQKAASSVGGIGALCAFIVLVLVIINVTIRKVAGGKTIKFVIAGLSFLAAALMAAALIIYRVNKKVQIRPPIPFEVNFDYGWSYYVSGVASGSYAIVSIIALFDACRTRQTNNEAPATDKSYAPSYDNPFGKTNTAADMHNVMSNGKAGNEPAVYYTNHAMAT